MYKLYYDAGASNMASHAALEEIGAPHELIHIDLDKGEQRSEAYLKVNPHARVPTLVHGDSVTYESTAILIYLCDRHQEAGLAPAIDSPQRGLYLQWLIYLTTTVQETLQHFDHPEFFVGEAAAQAALKADAEQRVDKMWHHLNAALIAGPYLLGESLSACDLSLTMMVRWTRNMAAPATAYPNIKRCIELVQARPAWTRMMEAEGIA